jgi:hypothetical protein
MIFTTDLSVCMEMCAWMMVVVVDRYSILKIGTRDSKINLLAVDLQQTQMDRLLG